MYTETLGIEDIGNKELQIQNLFLDLHFFLVKIVKVYEDIEKYMKMGYSNYIWNYM